ncbi:tRNA pseudouridine(38-40) synthase TruA [Helcobacillus massiliensis]|uniref:tRNA pseudouridine(38-40) synthase TruA n=1 Tax=Helcobacillus massiliensis TaxID=521392 RepID=UPI0021A299A1|nr:tRNA pseudouridine(38-40) synthase TruA [Helcobacillus massiliensis]MCT1558124.1 tRNA pseudouridine(38-40) synthase TruA [Helcobacillus massiliensis]MCT2037185.1 tRNA pseudouridine(38-40) synthase TruA [Helcobacillus massiliensis]MCT2332857.1 tRNA pseudouridine(38-40) synthase TruA [Helcobacillus massiliensis]
MRIRLDLAYDGTDFSGWSIQPALRTVQGEVEKGLFRILRHEVRVHVAGRTDAGVHATGQVLHVDVPEEAWARMPGRSDRTPGRAMCERLAAVLPRDIVVTDARAVSDDFDARFSALARRYRYRIADSIATRSPLRRDVMNHKRPLDAEAMDAAARALIGEHDFLSFCRPREDATTIRTLLSISWERVPLTDGAGHPLADAGLVVAVVEADAFCHHMVRSIVGASVAVGEGRADAAWMAALVATPRRDAAGSAPMFAPHGLTLESVGYPEDDQLAARAQQTRGKRGDTWVRPA